MTMQTAAPVTPREASRRYVGGFWTAMAIYVALVFAVPLWLRAGDVEGPLLWALAVLPALPLLRIIHVMGRYLLETDEYQRALQTRRMMAALGLTLGACSVYGFLETFADAPHIELYLVFPAFCAFWGITCLFVRSVK